MLLLCLGVSAQEKNTPTDHIIIEGKVKSAFVITLKEIMSMPSIHLDSCVIKNHMMQKKYTLTNMEVVPLKNILSKVSIDAEDPKQLSEFYFVFVASDNYKVVYSWNEIFNSSTGDHIFVIKRNNGNDATNQNDAISVLCNSDNATGRRYVKGLQKIIIGRAN